MNLTKSAILFLTASIFQFGSGETSVPPSLSKVKPIFEMNFDGGVTLLRKLKVAEVKTDKEIAFEPGLKGNGLVIERGVLECSLSESLVLSEGTIAFWFRPVKWDGISFVDFIRTYTVENQKWNEKFRIYVFPNHWIGLSVLRYLENSEKKNLFCNRLYVDHWRKDPEKWRQFSFTWKDGEGRLYIDGLLLAVDPDFEEKLNLGNRFRIGGETYRYENQGKTRILTNGKTIVDNLYIYDVALPHLQILREYEQIMGPLIETDDF